MPFIAPIIAAISGTVGSFLAGIGIVGKLAIGLGLNLVSAYLDKRAQEKAKKEAAGVQFDKQYGQDVPRQVPVGMVGQAGHDCYVNTWDKSNKQLQNLYILGDWPSGGLTDRIGVNGKWEALGPAVGDRGRPVLGEWEDLIWVRDIPGSLTQAVDPYLLSRANPDTRWSVEHRGIGMAMAVITLKYHQEKNNQFPEVFFESRGSVFYDFRKDSSVGGSGTHRWDNVATWEPTVNGMVALYCYMRGLRVGNDLFCGMGIPAADLPLSKWSLAMSLCDEPVENEPRYQVAAILDCGPDATHRSNVESLLKACGGYMMEGVDGIWPVVGSDQPVVATLTDEDIIRPRRGRFQRWRSQGQLVNKISGTHPNPKTLWAMEGYPAQIASNLLVSDRRSRDVPMDFPMVPSKRQAAQLASIYLMENRLEATASWTLRPRWMGLEGGDWIRVNSKRFGNFTFMITESSLASLSSDGPRNLNVNLQERNGSIYDATANPDDLFPPVTSAPPDYLPEVQNFDAIGVVVDVGGGKKYVAIRTSRDPIEDETVTGVDFRYWPTTQPNVVFPHTAKADVQVVPLVEGVVSKTEYQVQTRLVTDPPRTVAWSAPKVVLTPDQPNTDTGEGDSEPPGDPTGLVATPGVMFVLLEWVNPGDEDLDHIEAFMSLDNDITHAKLAASAQAPATSMIVPGIADTAIRYFWIRAVDLSGNKSGFSLMASASAVVIGPDQLIDGAVIQGKIAAGAVTAAAIMAEAVTAIKLAAGAVTNIAIADNAITASKILSQTIDATKFVADIKPVEIVTVLPSTALVEGRQVYLTTDKKVYRYSGTAWTAAVATIDLTGQIIGTQISDDAITTPKLAAGSIVAEKIATNAVTADAIAANAITAGKIQAGAVSAEQIAAGAIIAGKIGANAVVAENIVSKSITASKLYIGDTSNMFPDPEWADISDPTGGYINDATFVVSSNFTSSPASRVLQLDAANGNVARRVRGPAVPVDAGVDYYITCYAGIGGTTGTTAQVYATFYPTADGSGAQIGPNILVCSNTTIAGRNTLQGTQVTSPAGCKSLRLWFQRAATAEASVAVFSFPFIRRAASAELIVDGSITTQKIMAGSVTAAKIAANTITGDKMVANSITARELILTDFANLVPNGNFNEGTWANHILSNFSITQIRTAASAASLTDSGAYSLQCVKNAATDSMLIQTRDQASMATVEAGEYYYFETAVRPFDVSSPAGFYFWAGWWDSVGALIGAYVPIANNAAMPAAWTPYRAKLQAPAGAKYASFRITNHSSSAALNICIDRVVIREANGAELIVDGTITATHLAANSIIASKLAANAITADKIAANAVTANHINVTTLSSIAANVGTLTAGTLRDAASKMVINLTAGSIEWYD